jgi:hypothetical protein
MIGKTGLKVNMKLLEPVEWLKALREVKDPPQDLWFGGAGNEMQDPDRIYASYMRTGGPSAVYGSPEMDGMLEASRGAGPDEAGEAALGRGAQDPGRDALDPAAPDVPDLRRQPEALVQDVPERDLAGGAHGAVELGRRPESTSPPARCAARLSFDSQATAEREYRSAERHRSGPSPTSSPARRGGAGRRKRRPYRTGTTHAPVGVGLAPPAGLSQPGCQIRERRARPLPPSFSASRPVGGW